MDHQSTLETILARKRPNRALKVDIRYRHMWANNNSTILKTHKVQIIHIYQISLMWKTIISKLRLIKLRWRRLKGRLRGRWSQSIVKVEVLTNLKPKLRNTKTNQGFHNRGIHQCLNKRVKLRAKNLVLQRKRQYSGSTEILSYQLWWRIQLLSDCQG